MDYRPGEFGQISGPGKHSVPRTQSHVTNTATTQSRTVPSGKVYQQMFNAQGQLSRSLLAGWNHTTAQSHTHCSTASSKKDHSDSDNCDDVSGLPYILVAPGSSSDVIEQRTQKKRTKHLVTLEQLNTLLTEISKVFESQVRTECVKKLFFLQEVDLRLNSLSDRLERPEELKSASLQVLCSLWENIEKEVKLKSCRIMELYHSLTEHETQRSAQIQAVLKEHCTLLEKISFLPQVDIHRLVHSKAMMLNQLLLANWSSAGRLLLHLLVENLLGASLLHQRWEDCVENWKNSKVLEIIHHFSKSCSAGLDDTLYYKHPEIENIHQALREVSERRSQLISHLCLLVLPACTTSMVSDWFDQLKNTNHQIDALHGDLLNWIRSCFDESLQKQLAQVQNCENALQALQLPKAQITDIVNSRLLPLIGMSQRKADKQLADLDVSCNSVAQHSLSLSSSVYTVMLKAASLWEDHCSRLQNTEREVQRCVDTLRHSQEYHLERRKLHLDDQLRMLRQESSEKTLNTSLEKALHELQELKDSCSANLSVQNSVLDRLPALYLQELQDYSSRLSMFFHLSCTYTPCTEELEALDSAFSDLDLSLKATEEITDKGVQKESAQSQVESPLQDLYDMNICVEFISPRGYTYSGPTFKCQGLCPEEFEKHIKIQMFPVELLSQTLSRVRNLFMERLEQHFSHSLLSALTLLSHLKHKGFSEQDIHLQNLNNQHIHQCLFQPRLAELRLHLQIVDVHCQRVSDTLSSLSIELDEMQQSVKKCSQVFSCTMSCLDSSLTTVDSLQRLETLSSLMQQCLDKQKADNHSSYTSFKKTLQNRLEQLKQTTAQLLTSFRPFSDGGDFAPQEKKMFQKRLKREMKRISAAQKSILTKLQAFSSNHLQQAHENEVYGLQEKISILKSEFTFMEKTEKVYRNTQIQIKTEAASSKQQNSLISSKIEDFTSLLEKRDGQVCPALVSPTLSTLSDTLHQRCQYLHLLPISEQEDPPLSSYPAPPISAIQSCASGVGLHNDPLLAIIGSLNRSRTGLDHDTSPQREPRVRTSAPGTIKVSHGQSAKPLQEREECATSVRRGHRALRIDWRTQMFGARPESDTHNFSFSATVSSLLWKASDPMLLAAEEFYRCSSGVEHVLVPDTLEQFVEIMQQRLVGYQEQARSFQSTSRNEFLKQLTLLEEMSVLLAQVVIRKHTQQQHERLQTELSTVTQHLEKTVVSSQKEKSALVAELHLCISDEALQSLSLREQQRQQELNSAICISARAQEECVRSVGEDFVMSLASLSETLLHLYDQLLTAEEVNVLWQSGTTVAPEHMSKRTWQGIPTLPLSSAYTPSISTNKCTPGHQAVVHERDAAVKSFGELYTSEMQRLDTDKNKRLREVEKSSTHWNLQLHQLQLTRS